MNIDTQSIKEIIDARDVWRRYSGGVPIDRAGFARCVFHAEDTPSLKLYEGAKGFYCYGCHEGGDIFKLAGKLLGLDNFMDVVKVLNRDFSLGIRFDRRAPSRAEVEQAERAKKEREAVQQARDRFHTWMLEHENAICAYFRALQVVRINETPAGFADMSPLYLESLRELEQISYLLTVMAREPIKAYKLYKDWITDYAKRGKKFEQ